MKTIDELKNECIRIFGLEHENTQTFLRGCEFDVFNVEYLQSILNDMIMYQKINECKIAHAIVKLSTGEVVVVELVNQSFDFYASAWRAINDSIRRKYIGIKYIDVLDIITD